MHADGSATLTIGSVELGQGVNTVMGQIAAEVLEMDPLKIKVMTGDTDGNMICTGQFASRTTLVCGNAVKKAAEALKTQILTFAAAKLNTSINKLVYQDFTITSAEDNSKTVRVSDLATEAYWVANDVLIGIGRHVPQFAPRDNENGKADFFDALQYASCVAEVVVDDETGEVEVEKMYTALEMGTALNPMLLEGQIEGGASFGVGLVFTENVMPYYPSVEHTRTSYREYRIPTALDMPRVESILVEYPSPKGAFGAKGCGEIVGNCGGPAIVNAISNALGGIRFFELPITPEKILKALAEQQ
jgi:CO/xanthine dehydrogenase Mo-binding subunit